MIVNRRNNTSRATTGLMVGIARSVVPEGTVVEGHTMLLGPQIVTDEAALDRMLPALLDVARLCQTEDRAEALLIDGGPLAIAATAIATEMDLPIIEPVKEVARLAVGSPA